ncbi:peptidyl-tRNA hydrolase domain-like protein [Rhizopus microsporus var. microsporus]|uniref:Peptidyl-tRNA hydrolase domain-like protein n=2 Tax=Rhizopus microsporus TaxID=58291 RepID=A0A1X0RFS8_RHIZD|nr:peptidyl-tRNA hydrolase domain-like protein [Rhizopus microsporus var. microsporus]
MVLLISKRLSFSINIIKRYVSSKPWSYEQASAWIESFNKQKIPKEHTTVSFSRSSGPGGQNVNKVNTKVDLRLSLSKATWIPEYARDTLRSLPNVKKSKDDEVIITSDKTRSQSKNVQDCYDKLVTTIKQAVAVPREPDEATLRRVKQL